LRREQRMCFCGVVSLLNGHVENERLHLRERRIV
jgi:hypothetical protein